MARTESSSAVQWTAIIVAVIGLISTIGGAWITTYGGRSAETTAASAAVGQIDAGRTASSAPANAAASSAPGADTAPPAAIPMVIDEIAPPLPDSASIAYDQPWPNSAGLTGLRLERVESAAGMVRVHLVYTNTTGGAIRWYTSTGTGAANQSLQTYIEGKKDTRYAATGVGGSLFADPRSVALTAGEQRRGWIDYATDDPKLTSITLYLTSYTDSGSGGQTLAYQPLKFKLDR